jgi:hypothetical protein
MSGVEAATGEIARDDNWERLAEMGRQAVELGDGSRWALGALAQEVQTHYGMGAIKQWSQDVGKEWRRVYEYRAVVSAWRDRYSTYAEYRESFPSLSWSHLAYAAKLDRPSARIALLECAAAEGWTCERTILEVRSALGKTSRKPIALEAVGTLAELIYALRNGTLDASAVYRMVVKLEDNEANT